MASKAAREIELAVIIGICASAYASEELHLELDRLLERLSPQARRVIRMVYLTSIDGTTEQRRVRAVQVMQMHRRDVDRICQESIRALTDRVKEELTTRVCPEGT